MGGTESESENWSFGGARRSCFRSERGKVTDSRCPMYRKFFGWVNTPLRKWLGKCRNLPFGDFLSARAAGQVGF